MPLVKIKDFDGLIYNKLFFDQQVKNKQEAYEKVVEMSRTTCFASISTYASLLFVPAGMKRNYCAITTGIKKYNLIIKKSNKNRNKKVFLGRDMLNTIEVLISKPSIDSYISHDELASINSVLREYNEIKNYVKYVT